MPGKEQESIPLGPDSSPEGLRGELSAILSVEERLLRPNFTQFCLIKDLPLDKYPEGSVIRRVRAVHKLLFLTGGDPGDVITASDPWNNPIYTKLYRTLSGKPIDRNLYPVKEGEVQEALSSISFLVQKVVDNKYPRVGGDYEQYIRAKLLGSSDMPEVLSEASDIVFNLENLQDFEKEDFEYHRSVQALSSSFGYTESQILYLAWVKYHDRYVVHNGDKEIERENEIIGSLLRNGTLPIPSLAQLTRAYGEISIIHHTIIRTRLLQLNTEITRDVNNFLEDYQP